ncbi:uncharacterized protein KY384_005936 [Bacidia gigantensis]|uniref:uncharacterized protein n=1 Tax=Bacidia gigantensis TaxID=2732470 RepID=UPI001D05874C|nr:uncharacterized protein KY384_005936 [Bacidia gigantensis]KAG8529300.1 hypothetical protein KY384_005936 [Bacidia gigantensis]
MAMRGQRIKFDLNDSEPQSHVHLPAARALVGDIQEKEPSRVPQPPRPTGIAGGFPAHKDRQKGRPKRGKYRQELQSDTGVAIATSKNVDTSIDKENKARLANMSDKDIEKSKEELKSNLDPSVIATLLKRANIESDGNHSSFDEDSGSSKVIGCHSSSSSAIEKEKIHLKEGHVPESAHKELSQSDAPPLYPPADLHPVTSKEPLPSISKIHFPKAPPPPELDPDDPDFLIKLHSTYFPSLPSDPNTLAWMAPVKDSEQAPYSPSQDALPPSSLRFDFRGRLLPPRLSAQIPASKGLHHHGHTPDSAGYTVPELSHLARSAVTAQRCVAYQTLGRILFRLGRGDFGAEGEDLCEGLWELVEKGKVLPNIINAAARENEGSRSVWATATDAVWLWRKGGGRRWKGR